MIVYDKHMKIIINNSNVSMSEMPIISNEEMETL